MVSYTYTFQLLFKVIFCSNNCYLSYSKPTTTINSTQPKPWVLAPSSLPHESSAPGQISPPRLAWEPRPLNPQGCAQCVPLWRPRLVGRLHQVGLVGVFLKWKKKRLKKKNSGEKRGWKGGGFRFFGLKGQKVVLLVCFYMFSTTVSRLYLLAYQFDSSWEWSHLLFTPQAGITGSP